MIKTSLRLILGLFAITFSYAQTVPALDAVRVASGLSQPLFATAPPGDYNRLFIVQKAGQIRILNLGAGTLNSAPFLDLSASISTTSEQGLLGLAFDPNYASNGKFYLNFVVPGGTWGNGTTHISQFQVSSNPDVADSTNEKVLLTFDHPQANHDGGWIGFSPRPDDDHNLYIATGDGGNGNDQGTGHLEPGGNAQNTTTLLGKLLRIHVDATSGIASIPPNNPFVGSGTSRQEIFCYGLRNPFRDSFDRLTGRLFLGDVGQNTREEVDVQQATNPGGGENYGWRAREGLIQNPALPNEPVPGNAIDPILDYPHSASGNVITGNSITAGYVYRGKQIPGLRGTYVFADYIASKILTLNYDGASASNFQDVTAQLFPTATGGFNVSGPASYGEDANGELYICSLNNGALFRIVPATANVTIDSANRSGGGPFILKGTGVPFTSVTIKSTSDLTQPFTFLTTVPVANDGTYEFDDSTSAGPQFYRVTYP